MTVPGKPDDDLPSGTWDSILTVRIVGMNEPVKYTVVIEKAPSNYGAYVPDLPGCVAAGSTREAVLAEIREAIAFHIESLREHGEPVPKP